MWVDGGGFLGIGCQSRFGKCTRCQLAFIVVGVTSGGILQISSELFFAGGKSSTFFGLTWITTLILMHLHSYNSAIDIMKSQGDYQWQAAAMENLICCQLIALLKRAGFGVSEA